MSIRILHLEDNIADAELIQIELEKEYGEYQIKHVSNRDEYIAALELGEHDIVLSDYNVPLISGLESIELSKSYGPNVPFIYVSGAIGEEGAVEMLKSGAADYVLKSKLEKLHISIFRSVQAHKYLKLVEEKEQLIKEQQQEYRYLIDRINEGFIKVNTKSEITLVNPAVCELFQSEQSELIGQNINTLLDLPVKHSDFQITDIHLSLEFDRVLTRSNNDRFWAHIRISNQLNELSESTGYAIIIRDITDQKLSEVWEGIISNIARKLSTTESSIHAFFDKLHRELKKHVPCENFYAMLCDESDQLELTYFENHDQSVTPQQIIRESLALQNHIQQTKEPVWLKGNEIKEFEVKNDIKSNGNAIKSLIKIPIIAEDKCIGIMGCVDCASSETFNEFHFKVMTYVGSHIGIFIRKLESEINRNRILQLSEDLICTMNKSGELTYVNPAFENQLGYNLDELMYQPLSKIFLESDKDSILELENAVTAFNGVNKFDSSIITKNRKIRSVYWTIMSQEKDQTFYCIGRDFTERQIIQKQIEESERRYRGLFQRMNEGLVNSNSKGVILRVNPSFCKMLGYTESELIGKVGYDFLHDKETAKRLRQKMRHRKTGKPGLYETTFLHKDGSTVWAHVSATPDYNSQGNFSGVMMIILDITDRKKAENAAFQIKEAFTKELENSVVARTKELEDARKELAISLKKEKELGRLKSRFVSMASHQFRTPLSVIQSNLGVLSMHMDTSKGFKLDKELQPKFHKISDRIKSQITRMTDLMNDVLILGKINEGNITIRLAKQPLVPVCQDILDNENYIKEKTRNLLQVIGKPIDLYFDKQLFSHAFSNLVSNAFKYTKGKEQPTVSIEFLEEQTVIKVSDKGIGIPAEELPHLFEPFYRASNVKEFSGTGLGTAIAKEYIELIGGTISVESTLGVGTEFTITLNNNNHGENSDS
ncbi:MAG: PAS domain S-box protein [bacterium]|nr:PAS domain S-box protein [bacterium]